MASSSSPPELSSESEQVVLSGTALLPGFSFSTTPGAVLARFRLNGLFACESLGSSYPESETTGTGSPSLPFFFFEALFRGLYPAAS